MNIKITMKLGDDIRVMDEDEQKTMMGNPEGFEQLMLGKGQMSGLINFIELTQPNMKGKRIEMIMEFDDGQYIVIGRKPKEVTEFGT